MLDLARNLPVVLIVIAVLVVLIVAYVVFLLLRSGARTAGEEEAAEPGDAWADEEWPEGAPPEAETEDAAEGTGPPPAASGVGLRRSFRRAVDRAGRFISGPGALYKVPWFLVLGAAGSRPHDLWQNAGVSLPFGGPDDYSSDDDGCNWWFYDRGVVIDLGGNHVLREHGEPADPRGLQRFLELCQKHRPRRPLDGVVVTISCAELIAARERGSEGTVLLKERADQVYRALWRTQNRLGLRFPVYVLVTGLEKLEGFTAFCDAVPGSVGREIFGWSSPYQLGTSYASAWVDEAFAAIGRRLDEARLEVLSEVDDEDTADGVFALPAAVQALEGPLGRYLDQLLKPSAYHEEILFRGLYFCGMDGAGRQALDAPRATFFLADLLEHKVFPEANLARPAGARLVATHRTVRLAQAALVVSALVLGLGTLWAVSKLRQNGAVLEDFLEKSVRARALIQGDGTSAGAELGRRSVRLFADMSHIDVDHFASFFLPRSWLSGFEERLEEGLHHVFREIIFRVMADALEERGLILTASAPPAPAAAAPIPAVRAAGFRAWPSDDVVPPDRTEEFRAFAGFIGEMTALERAAGLYNGLSESGDPEAFGEVVEYLTGEQLPAEFFTHSRLYAQAMLGAGSTFDLEAHRVDAVERSSRLAAGLYRRITDDSPLAGVLADAAGELDALADAPWRLEGDTEAVEGLRAAFEAAAEALTRTAYEWAFREPFTLGPAYEQVLSEVSASRLFGPEIADELRRDGEAAWINFRRRLMSFESRYTGPLLAIRDDRPRMELSPDVQVLMAAVEDFLDQEFMNADERRPLKVLPEDSRLRWSVPGLEDALAAFQPYDRFRSRTLQMFPAGMRPALDTVARRRLGLRTTTLVAGAQRFEPVARSANPRLLESQLRGDVESFVAAAPSLENLLISYRELGLDAEHDELSEAVVEQGRGLLTMTAELLLQEQLWGADFERWDGGGNVALAAFDKADGDELALYLELQRLRVEELATGYAQKPVEWLSKTGLDRHWRLLPTYSFWERVITSLVDYGNKKPGNALAALEELIAADMSEIDLAGCHGALPAAAPGAGGNYFRSRLNDLRRGLRQRCGELSQEIARRRYAEVERLFNRRLAGRFPFAAEPGALVGDVEPADIEAFFRLFDRSLELLRTLPATPGSPDLAWPEAPGDFVRGMTEVRAFFAHYLDADPPAEEPVYDLDVAFRVHPQPGDGSHEIIDWELAVAGAKPMTRRDGERRARWAPGRSLRLSLRWAKDSPRIPLALKGQPGASAEDGEVRLGFSDPWSLFHLLADHPSSASDFAVPAEVEPHTLKFEIATGPRPAEEENGKGKKKDRDRDAPPDEAELGEVRAFIRVGLAAPESKDPLELPVFPRRAPEAEAR